MSTPSYRERLTAPLRWWVQATMFLVVVWIAFIVSTPEVLAWVVTGAAAAITYALLARIGAAAIRVEGGELRAGRARIPLTLLGTPEPLDAAATRRALGVEADARAYLLVRPYLKQSVRVALVDPEDPTPYWLLSTRRPLRLSEVLAKPSAGR